jgi:hypothetical protein
MNIPARIVCLCVSFLVLGVATGGFAQSVAPADSDTVSPGFVRMPPVSLDSIISVTPDMTLVFPADATTSRGSVAASNDNASVTNNSNGSTGSAGEDNGEDNDRDHEIRGGKISGLDTVPTFAGAFASEGGPTLGTVYPFIMVGHNPLQGGTTHIPAKMTAVSLQLLNKDGTVNLNVPFGPFEDLTEDSPNFLRTPYTSSEERTQFADAVQRAEFFNAMDEDWHTDLKPEYVDRITLRIPQFVNVRFPNGTIKPIQAYYIKTAPNGKQFYEVLDLLFNSLNFQAEVGEIVNNNFSTQAINFTVYPDTYLFSIDTNGDVAGCCVLGYHTYIFRTGATPQPRWLAIYASWISPGIFRGGLQDVTGLSHEISETLNDPFINNLVPRWHFPGLTACQGNLETGDPVEVLANTTVSIQTREGHEIFTYHPQTEALLQWFQEGTTSDALHGAFSYPNEAALPHSAVPCIR